MPRYYRYYRSGTPESFTLYREAVGEPRHPPYARLDTRVARWIEDDDVRKSIATGDATLVPADEANALLARLSDEYEPKRTAFGPLPPRTDGLVYCCSSMGWVEPGTAADHQWDTSRSFDEYAQEYGGAWDIWLRENGRGPIQDGKAVDP